MQRYIVRKMGTSKGNPRIYLDLNSMNAAGFEPGKSYSRKVESRRITLTIEEGGPYLVSCKHLGSKTLPIIDINSSNALKSFEGMEAVRIVVDLNKIYILPLASEANRLDRLERLKKNLDKGELTTAGISFGGGVLDHSSHAGFKEAGLHASLAFANEIDESLLDHAREHNDIWLPSTVGAAAPMQELVQDFAAMNRIPQVDICSMGIPCSGASIAGKSKRKLDMMESHPSVGHLVASAIMLINRIQPSVLVVENVPQYADTASAQILRQHLRDCGYNVQETKLGANDFGCMENRVRWFMVAATNGIDINLDDLAPVLREVKVIGDILEPIGPDAQDWRSFDYLKTKEARDAEKGNSFSMQIVTSNSTTCPTLRKGYAKGGSTDPLLLHPTDPELLRPFTVKEHARIKQVPEHLVADMSKTDGHILLGQGIAYAPVKALFKRIGRSLIAWRDALQAEQPAQQQVLGYSLMRATG